MNTLLVLLSLFIILVTEAYGKQTVHNNRPTIAVLAQRFQPGSNKTYIAASYVKYLESAGARVVPITGYMSASKIKEIFSYVNGVLYPGGSGAWFTSPYYKHAAQFWSLASRANDIGDYFPIWGTCYGFQTMHVLQTSKPTVIIRRVSSDLSLPLNFTSGARKSKLFGRMPPVLFDTLAKDNLSYNHHHYGVSPEAYHSNEQLKDFFKILSTNTDIYGREFISTIEAYKYPFYAVQWHPEKNSFEFTTNYQNIPHSSNAVKLTQYLANYFVDEARKSAHRFPSTKMEEEYLIYRYQPTHSAMAHGKHSLKNFEQVYIF